MGFEIEVNVGGGKTLWLRGCDDGQIELCTFGKLKKRLPDDEDKEGLTAFKYYANPVQAFERILKMRVGSCDAKTLGELSQCIKDIRADIKAELSTTLGNPTLVANKPLHGPYPGQEGANERAQGMDNGIPSTTRSMDSNKEGRRKKDRGPDQRTPDQQD